MSDDNGPIPEQWAAVIDQVSERDRAYFEAHPEVEAFLRPMQPGEFGPYEPAEPLVLVTRIADGIRTREPAVLVALGGSEVLQ